MAHWRQWDGDFQLSRAIGQRSSSPIRRISHMDFREHYGFLALMLVCGACVVYLMTVLRSILRPFLWALFLVMGLTPAVALVERALFCCADLACRYSAALLRCLCKWCRWVLGTLPCCQRCRRQDKQRANLLGTSQLAPASGRFGMRRTTAPAYRQRRQPSQPPDELGDGSDQAPAVIGSAIVLDERGAAASTIPGRSRFDSSSVGEQEEPEDDIGASPVLNAQRQLEAVRKHWGPCARFLVHAVAIALVVAAVVCVIGSFVVLVVESVLSLQGHFEVYKQGFRNIANAVERLVSSLTGSLPKELAEEVTKIALAKSELLISALVTEVLSSGWRFVLELLMMALYIVFWLSDPMPVGSKMEELFKRYIILKGTACLGYGLCTGLLLQVLGVDMAPAFGVAAFLLSFVPEVGAIVALLLPAPVILFDSRLDSPFFTLIVATSAQLGLKFVFANVVEVKLVEADQLMKMHPVIILLAVSFFGFLWGPTGMLLSVPLVAYFKVALLGNSVPNRYRDPILIILEGDRSAPAKYDRKQRDRRRHRAPPAELQAAIESPRRRVARPDDPTAAAAAPAAALAAAHAAAAIAGGVAQTVIGAGVDDFGCGRGAAAEMVTQGGVPDAEDGKPRPEVSPRWDRPRRDGRSSGSESDGEPHTWGLRASAGSARGDESPRGRRAPDGASDNALDLA